MADLSLRRDPATPAYLYLTSRDGYPIPGTEWRTLTDRDGPYRADYSHEHKGELRLRSDLETDVLDLLASQGHSVTRTVGSRPAPGRRAASRGPMECAVCGQPYPRGKVVAPGETCAACARVVGAGAGPHELRLRPPHACGPECGQQREDAARYRSSSP